MERADLEGRGDHARSDQVGRDSGRSNGRNRTSEFGDKKGNRNDLN